jgi:hypothetical protein
MCNVSGGLRQETFSLKSNHNNKQLAQHPETLGFDLKFLARFSLKNAP